MIQLLKEPYPDDALVPAIAEEYTSHYPEFAAHAKKYTQLYAIS